MKHKHFINLSSRRPFSSSPTLSLNTLVKVSGFFIYNEFLRKGDRQSQTKSTTDMIEQLNVMCAPQPDYPVYNVPESIPMAN